MAEGKICDNCEKTKAEYICAMCNKDLCKRCTSSPEIKMEYKSKSFRYTSPSYEVYRMAKFNFCTSCVSKIPWNNKEPLDEETHQIILDSLKRRILAEEIVKQSGGK